MIQFTERADASTKVSTTVTLPMDKRVKSRQRVTLDDGRDAGIMLERGEHLHHGDKLISDSGEAIEVQAAQETVSQVNCIDSLLFARACYHLGNRHVPAQIDATEGSPLGITYRITYLHDHVLDDMLRGLGLTVDVTQSRFNPEPGAYGGGHAHSHSHDH